MQSEQPITCPVCKQLVVGIGPWCKLYITDRFCPPLIRLRARILDADEVGDGPLVNALCAHIRKYAGDNYVP